MITGYNTDIEFDGVIYHVQTEDKGTSSPVIMSLVYNRGTILASKRVPYDDLLDAGIDETALSERLQRQHKLMCAAVSAGRIEDLKKMSARNLKAAAAKRASRKKKAVDASTEPANGVGTTVNAERDLLEFGDELPVPPKNGFAHGDSTGDLLPIGKPENSPLFASKIEPPTETIIDVVDIFDDDSPVLVEAVEAVSDLGGTTRPENDKLSIDVIGESRFKGGEQKDFSVMVCRGSRRKVVALAEIMVKILGSSFRPVIWHSRTDKNGLAMIQLKVPHFQSGRATVIVRAISSGEEVEIRRPVEHG